MCGRMVGKLHGWLTRMQGKGWNRKRPVPVILSNSGATTPVTKAVEGVLERPAGFFVGKGREQTPLCL